MNKNRRLPQRMCVGCREMKDKRELVRVVRSPAGEVDFDPTGKKPGRGAYVCKDAGCLQQALKSKRLQKALESSIHEEVINQLKIKIEQSAL